MTWGGEPPLPPYLAAFTILGAVLAGRWLYGVVSMLLADGTPMMWLGVTLTVAAVAVTAYAVARWVTTPGD